MYITRSFRIKDSGKSLQRELKRMASSVNFVWNYANDVQMQAVKRGKIPKQWPSASDLCSLTSGASKELGLNATTIQSVVQEYVQKRVQFRKNKLNWRSYKKSLPWIPFKANGIKIDLNDGVATYCGLTFKFWNSRSEKSNSQVWHSDLSLGTLKTGSICADARGRWYLNLTYDMEFGDFQIPDRAVGIDLGLKDVLTLSTGQSVSAQRYYRAYENKLAKAQRAKKKKQVRNIHAKVKNLRKDFNHKVTTEIANNFNVIHIGNVSSSDLAATNMAKSVLDAGWFQIKSFLKYKALARKTTFREVNEAYSTQTCSACGYIPTSSPKGKRDLNIREWVCSSCGVKHNRDTNAAQNILRFGHESPTNLSFNVGLVLEGIPGLQAGEDVKCISI